MILTRLVGRIWIVHYVSLELRNMCFPEKGYIRTEKRRSSLSKIVQNDFDDRRGSVAGTRYRKDDSNECGWLRLSRTDRMLSGAFEIAFSSQIVHKPVHHQQSSPGGKYFVHLQHQVAHPHP
jgi:hypothetical protein